MKVRISVFACLSVLLVMACSGIFTPTPIPSPVPTATTTEVPLAPLEFEPTMTLFKVATPMVIQPSTPSLPATMDASCLNDQDNALARAIADDFTFTSYFEVMVWFCSGAEFEDIVTALQTEEISGTAAEEMLAMLADGFSWEEIWQLLGVTE